MFKVIVIDDEVYGVTIKDNDSSARIRRQIKKNRLFHSGGSGSGFEGHKGRPGKVGGSKSMNVYGREKSKLKGLFTGKHIPVIDDLSYNSTREGLALRAMEGIKYITKYPSLKGKVIGATLQGGFLSDKEFPKDIDIILEFSDKESMTFFAKEVVPDIVHRYGRVEFGYWSKEVPASVEAKDLYNAETEKRYGVSPVDLSEWLR